MIALYARVSTQEQALHGSSIEEQHSRMRSYCDALGWVVYKVYTDAGFSGSNTHRPALQELLRAVSDHKVDKVLVYKLDRLSRSQRDTLELIEDHFLANGVDFVSMSENFDTSTPLGKAMVGILAVFAQLEREQIKERMMMGRQARAKKGKYNGSRTDPIGYDYIDGSLVINEHEALQIRRIYDLFLGGMSPMDIQRTLTQEGFSTKYGDWKALRIRRILRSKLYCGYVSFDGKWTKGLHDPIISEDDWKRADRIMTQRREEYSQGVRRGNAYLTGLVYCARCGAHYSKRTATSGGKTYYYYTCNSRSKKTAESVKDPNCRNKSWRMQDLDNLIFDQLRQLTILPEDEERKKESVEPIEKEIRSIEKQISRLIDLYAMQGVSADVLEGKIKTLQDRSDRLTEARRRILAEQEDNSTERMREALTSLDSVLDEGSFDDIVFVLHELIEKISIDGDDVTIQWRFS